MGELYVNLYPPLSCSDDLDTSGASDGLAKAMDHLTCCVVYCDDRVRTERLVKRDAVSTSATNQKSSIPGYFDLLEEHYELQSNVKAILGVFNSGKLCRSPKRIPMLSIHNAVLCALIKYKLVKG